MLAIQVRDLHASHPDDYAPGSCDLLVTAADGRKLYSDEIFCSRDEAQVVQAGYELSGIPDLEDWYELTS